MEFAAAASSSGPNSGFVIGIKGCLPEWAATAKRKWGDSNGLMEQEETEATEK
jgi:hypothetical protein